MKKMRAVMLLLLLGFLGGLFVQFAWGPYLDAMREVSEEFESASPDATCDGVICPGLAWYEQLGFLLLALTAVVFLSVKVIQWFVGRRRRDEES